MSWLFSLALVGAFSEESCSDGEPSAQLSVMPTQRLFWRNDKMMDCSIFSRFGLTWRHLTADRGEALLMSFLADFPVRTFHAPERVQESRASKADYGRKWHASLAKYDHDSHSWKTIQLSLLGDSAEFSGTWPRWGTMRNGVCWERAMSERLTREKESGYSLPTPTVHGNYNRKGCSPTSGDGLATAAKVRPTPTQQNRNSAPLNAVAGGSLNPTWVEWLMGWPLGWTGLRRLETDKFRQWQRSHGTFYQQGTLQ